MVFNSPLNSYTCIDLLGRDLLWDEEMKFGSWFCLLSSDFSNLKLCSLTRRFYAGKQLKGGSWPSRPWIFLLARVCLFSTFHFCLLKIWLTGLASRETPFSFDKVQWERERGHSKVAESASPLQHHMAWYRALSIPEDMEPLWSLSLWSKAVVGKHQQLRLFRDCPSSGTALTTKNIGACWMRLFFLVFRD